MKETYRQMNNPRNGRELEIERDRKREILNEKEREDGEIAARS